MVFADQNRPSEEEIERDVLTLDMPDEVSYEQRDAPIPKHRRLSEISDSEKDWLTHGIRPGTRSTKVSGLENLHGFYGIIVMREHHHSVAMQPGHLFMHLHPPFGDTKYPVEKGSVGRCKLRLSVIISVKADREAMGVLTEHPSDLRRTPSIVVRDE
jgi:hypothetical protein